MFVFFKKKMIYEIDLHIKQIKKLFDIPTDQALMAIVSLLQGVRKVRHTYLFVI